MKNYFMVSLNLENVEEFLRICESFDFDIDLCMYNSNYMIDAKSIMGIYSLDLQRPLKVIVHDEAQIDELRTKCAKFII